MSFFTGWRWPCLVALGLAVLLLPGGCSKPAVYVEIKALRSKSADEREAAALHLADLNRTKNIEKAVPPLVEALNDPEAKVRAAAAQAFGAIGIRNEEGLARVKKLVSDPDEKVVRNSLGVVKALGSRADYANACATVLKSTTTSLKVDAARELAGMGEDAEPAIEGLQEGLKHEEPNLRLYCIVALGNLGPKAINARTTVWELQKDRVKFVREAAMEAVKKIKQQ